MLLSIIIPIFNESSENIRELYDRIAKVCGVKEYQFEILFVNDGSTNGILYFLKNLHSEDKKVKVISLNRNYGQAIAVSAGFYFAKGDIFIVMDADLQYLPEEIPYFVEKIRDGYDAVAGRRAEKFISSPSQLLTFSLNLLLGDKIHDYGCAYNALTKEVVKRIFKLGFTSAIKPMAVICARNKTEIDVTFCKRRYGFSKYSSVRYFIYGVKYFLSFLIVKRQKRKPFTVAMVLE